MTEAEAAKLTALRARLVTLGTTAAALGAAWHAMRVDLGGLLDLAREHSSLDQLGSLKDLATPLPMLTLGQVAASGGLELVDPTQQRVKVADVSGASFATQATAIADGLESRITRFDR